jgi:hypothetical protein
MWAFHGLRFLKNNLDCKLNILKSLWVDEHPFPRKNNSTWNRDHGNSLKIARGFFLKS